MLGCRACREGKAATGAKHLLTALTCFLRRKQTQVHTREAIRRKALIPICNCFSMSVNRKTGPKSGATAQSPVPVRAQKSVSPFCARLPVVLLHKPRRKQTILLTDLNINVHVITLIVARFRALLANSSNERTLYHISLISHSPMVGKNK